MNPVLREYLAKGVFLGLWSYLALIQPDAATFARIIAWGLGGLALGLVAGVGLQLRRGYRPTANPVAFLLLVVLDSPYFVYLGLIGGFAWGILTETDAPEGRSWLGYSVAAGALLGFGLHQLRQVKDWFYRFALGLVVGGLGTYLAIHFIDQIPALVGSAPQRQFGIYLLLGLPFFYLLTLAGEAEESEAEIAAICAAGGIGLYLLRLDSKLPEHFDKLIFLVPVVAYFVYSTKLLPALRTFKHNLRGYGYLSLGRYREALVSFGRALHLDRRNRLAADGVRKLMEALDTRTIDDETAKLLPVEYCLETVTGTLIDAEPPTEKQRDDALRMLDIVARQRPDLSPRVRYLRAVGLTHARQFDAAASELSAILDPAEQPGAVRDGVLFPSWDLALRVHPELVKRLGAAELARPGRRLDAIAAVERHLAKQPEDAAGIVLKRELYATLHEAEFVASSSAPSPEAFNYDYVEQLGQTLLADADPAQVERGLAYLRVAGRGSPARGPVIFQQLADAATKLGRADEAAGYLGQIKRSGLNAGPDKLTAENRAIYTDALKRLVDAAVERKDFASAVDDMRLYVEAGHENAGTLRKLAEYYASSGDELNALLIAERGLLYAKADPDLLAKKDSYYYSVSLDRIRGVRDKVATWFDVPYLVRKSKQVADQKEVDPETIDYGLHLARLARIVAPTSHGAMLSEARLLLRKGDRDAGLSILEDVREQPRGSGDEEDAWFIAVRLLGDLYLDELDRPDLAVGCYSAFREYQKSGADTLFLLGKAYEKSGNLNAAIKSYESVTMYPQHPRFYEATEAARRLKSGGAA